MVVEDATAQLRVSCAMLRVGRSAVKTCQARTTVGGKRKDRRGGTRPNGPDLYVRSGKYKATRLGKA